MWRRGAAMVGLERPDSISKGLMGKGVWRDVAGLRLLVLHGAAYSIYFHPLSGGTAKGTGGAREGGGCTYGHSTHGTCGRGRGGKGAESPLLHARPAIIRGSWVYWLDACMQREWAEGKASHLHRNFVVYVTFCTAFVLSKTCLPAVLLGTKYSSKYEPAWYLHHSWSEGWTATSTLNLKTTQEMPIVGGIR